jgi:hypothetical protein
VTDVQPKGQEPGLTPTEVTLLVGFRYYERSEGRIRSLQDRQRWYYAEDSKRWLLDSDLPDFAGQR